MSLPKGLRVARPDSYVVGTVVSDWDKTVFMLVLWDGDSKPKLESCTYVKAAKQYQEDHNRWRLRQRNEQLNSAS